MNVLLVVVIFLGVYYVAVVAAVSIARSRLERDDRPRDAEAGATPWLLSTGVDRSPVLASDRDRDRATRIIGAAMAQGRLDLDEGIERIEAALSARRWSDLAALEADLPSSFQGTRR